MHDEYDILRQVIPAPACATAFLESARIADRHRAQRPDHRQACQHGHPGTVRHLPHRPVTWRPRTRPKSKTSFIRWGSIVRKPSISSDWPRHWTNDSAGVVPRTNDELTSLPGVGSQNRERRARQRVRYPRIPGRYACDARNRTTALAVGLAVRTPRSRENREGNHLLFSARRVDESQPPTDSVRPGHLPRTYP